MAFGCALSCFRKASPKKETRKTTKEKNMIHKSLTALLTAHCLLLTANAYSLCLQFDASSPSTLTLNGTTVTAWTSVKGSTTLVPIHGASNGWSTATLQSISGRSSVSFMSQDGVSIPSPFAFHGTETTQSVVYVFAIVRSQVPTFRMTLLDAPIDIRLESNFPFVGEGVPEGRGSGLFFQEEQLGNIATYAINGHSTSTFLPSEKWQAVEVTLQTPTSLNALFIGGSIPSPAWKRNFNGNIAELIFLGSAPTLEQRNALYHYARAKWRVPVDYDFSPHSANILRNLGVDPKNVFATFFLVR